MCITRNVTHVKEVAGVVFVMVQVMSLLDIIIVELLVAHSVREVANVSIVMVREKV